MTNKLHIILLGALFLLISCNNNNKINITINLNKLKSSCVYLQEINSIPFLLIDSVNIKNNRFTIKNYITNEGLYKLLFDNKNAIYLYLKKGDDIKIDFANDFYQYKISGNNESVQLQYLNQLVVEKGREIDSLALSILDSLFNDAQKDSLNKILEYKILTYKNRLKEFVEVQENASVAAFALNYFGRFAQQEMPYIVKKVDELYAKTPKSLYVKQFNDALQQYKQAILKQEQAGFQLGTKAPNIELENKSGDTLSLNSLLGKYVLLDFWASWCPPCRAENPTIVKLYHQYKSKGLEVFSVSLDEDIDSWKNAIKKDKLVWDNHVSDLKGWQSSVVQLYKIEALPTTYLLDKSGKIIAKNLRGAELEQKLAELFLDK